MKQIYLKRGKEESLLRFHPWVFSGAIQHADQGIEEGDLFCVTADWQDNESMISNNCDFAAKYIPDPLIVEVEEQGSEFEEIRLNESKTVTIQTGGDTVYYRFVPDIPGDDHPGTFHSVDLWFFFETLAKDNRPFEGRHYDLARQMCDYWANFIKTGDPNGYDINGNKLPEWRPYTDADRAEMEFTPDGAVAGVENSSFTRFLLDHVK